MFTEWHLMTKIKNIHKELLRVHDITRTSNTYSFLGDAHNGLDVKVTLDSWDSRELLQNILVLLILWCENAVGKVWLGLG